MPVVKVISPARSDPEMREHAPPVPRPVSGEQVGVPALTAWERCGTRTAPVVPLGTNATSMAGSVPAAEMVG